MLVGLELDGGWTVVSKLPRPTRATGGCFSVSYKVESRRGKRGFLKALDYTLALEQPDVPRALQDMTSAYNHERDLLHRCARMSRVVTALGHGKIQQPAWFAPVDYLVFEWAHQDSRAFLDTVQQCDTAWILRTLHHTSVGLQQLHAERIAHQDVKPSNVLMFGTLGSKLADLGRSSYRGSPGPFDGHDFPGDLNYAPPEVLYGQISREWTERRLASDMYQLGSLAMFFFTRSGTTTALLAELDRCHAPQNWAASYKLALPHVQQAFVQSIDRLETMTPSSIRHEISRIIGELCNPDPSRRGHPRNRIGHSNKYGLERYVSRFDLLAQRAELGLLGSGS